jgi:hypothetical protein
MLVLDCLARFATGKLGSSGSMVVLDVHFLLVVGVISSGSIGLRLTIIANRRSPRT